MFRGASYRASLVAMVLGLTLSVSLACGEVRNVVLFIGDGMGPQQVGLLLQYARVKGNTTNLERFMGMGRTALALTNSYGHLVTDSAAAATAIACGRKTRPGMLGLDAEGREVPTILELARDAGRGTGLVTTTKVTDATPGGFSAHVLSRGRQDQIAEQQLERSKPDVLLGGGLAYWIPKGRSVKEYGPAHYFDGGFDRSKREDQADLVARARSLGYRVSYDRKGLERTARLGGRLLGLFAARNLPFAIERRRMPTMPSLSTMTRAALSVLDRRKDGFFLMVEGASIDLMSHNNDLGATLQELLDFDEALGEALPYARRGDTLVLVTADHATGGPGFYYNRFREPQPVKLASGKTWRHWYDFVPDGRILRVAEQRTTLRAIAEGAHSVEELMASVKANTAFALTRPQAERLFEEMGRQDYDPKDPDRPFYPHKIGRGSTLLARELGGTMGVSWAAGTHDTTPVIFVGAGPGAERIRGVMDNTEIFRVMSGAMGLYP